MPHLHLATAASAMVLRDAGLIGAAQIAVLALARHVAALAARRRRGDKAGMHPC